MKWNASLCVGLCLVALSSTVVEALAAEDFKVVVHASNPISSLPLSQVSRIFLKKTTRWDDGTDIVPVDQTDRSEVRSAFSEAVHGRSVASIKSYWQRLIFSGRGIPPEELETDAEVLAFVARQPGAIGYVSASARLNSSVKAISLDE